MLLNKSIQKLHVTDALFLMCGLVGFVPSALEAECVFLHCQLLLLVRREEHGSA